MKTCSISGSTERAVRPIPDGFTGILRYASISSPNFSAALLKISRHSSRSLISRGKKTTPTPYLPKAGKCTPSLRHSSKKNSCGICIVMPAPSPVLFSQPQAPRCSIFSSTVSASEITWCDLLPLIFATNPIPQASCSKDGSYKPACLSCTGIHNRI